MAATQLPGSAPSGVQSGGKPNLRKTYIGIPPTNVLTTASVDVNVPVLEPFRGDRLILEPAAQVLRVSNIRVGTKPLNVSSNPISGNAFSEQAINTELSGYTAKPGTGITLSVVNPTGATVVLAGGMVGWAAL